MVNEEKRILLEQNLLTRFLSLHNAIINVIPYFIKTYILIVLPDVSRSEQGTVASAAKTTCRSVNVKHYLTPELNSSADLRESSVLRSDEVDFQPKEPNWAVFRCWKLRRKSASFFWASLLEFTWLTIESSTRRLLKRWSIVRMWCVASWNPNFIFCGFRKVNHTRVALASCWASIWLTPKYLECSNHVF